MLLSPGCQQSILRPLGNRVLNAVAESFSGPFGDMTGWFELANSIRKGALIGSSDLHVKRNAQLCSGNM